VDAARLQRLLAQADSVEERHGGVVVQAPGEPEHVVVAPKMDEERRLDVFERGEAAEDAGDLKRAPHAEPADVLGRKPVDFFAEEGDPARVAREVAGDQVEERRLAGTVGTNDGAEVALGDRKVHPVHGLDATEVLREIDGLED